MSPVAREAHLPLPHKAEIAREHFRRGSPVSTAVRALSPVGKYSGGTNLALVKSVYAEPDMFDTYVDRVAVERAFHGDKEVWDAMTYYEKAALVDYVVQRADEGATNSAWPGHVAMVSGDREKGWVYLLAETLGMSPDRFRKIRNKRNAVERQRRANAEKSS